MYCFSPFANSLYIYSETQDWPLNHLALVVKWSLDLFRSLWRLLKLYKLKHIKNWILSIHFSDLNWESHAKTKKACLRFLVNRHSFKGRFLFLISTADYCAKMSSFLNLIVFSTRINVILLQESYSINFFCALIVLDKQFYFSKTRRNQKRIQYSRKFNVNHFFHNSIFREIYRCN